VPPSQVSHLPLATAPQVGARQAETLGSPLFAAVHRKMDAAQDVQRPGGCRQRDAQILDLKQACHSPGALDCDAAPQGVGETLQAGCHHV
jgi:hypothetical protein